ncbi:PucR family transcriptional regulator [Caldalkalibacillus mannanilyticus]|uniref:PucR family transcriptional regulator n=1 Tax=Caldalkalibacillus mannanilyticus TaxID=1418 RepID=UPI000A512415|nr:helix-turn-helix domain-containing protein [Caldalkalibacillus mannanilyticus]
MKSNTSIKDKAEKLHIKLPECYQVLVFRFDQKIDDNLYKQIQYILTTLQRIRIISHVTDRSRLVLLISSSDDPTFKESLTEFMMVFTTQMEERFQSFPIESACGSLMKGDYSKVEKSYQEALTVLRLKRKFPIELQHTYHYHDMGFYLYLPWLYEKKKGENMGNPHLQALRRYDQENGTHLYHTLEIFLSLDCNVKETAEKLHVHINTLNYRLKRIEEISRVHLKSMDQKVSLYLDMKAEKYEE